MNRLVLLIICIFASVECSNALCCNDKKSLSCKETFSFEYKGVVREMYSNINVCDSLLSVYIEEKVQDLASKGFEGKFLIRARLTIGKNGKVKKAIILSKHKEMRKVYSEVSDVLKDAMFKPCLKNSSPKKTSIMTLLIIDTYQYPSNINRMIFGLK